MRERRGGGFGHPWRLVWVVAVKSLGMFFEGLFLGGIGFDIEWEVGWGES